MDNPCIHIYSALSNSPLTLRDLDDIGLDRINEAKEKANSEGAKLLDNARTSIQTEKAAALTEIKNLVGTLSVQIAEQMLKKELNNDSSNLALIQQYLNDAKLN